MTSVKGIFRDNALQYWEKGLVALPVEYQGKKPLVREWSSFHNRVSEKKRDEWLSRFPDANLGVLMGTDLGNGFRLGAIDVDDDALVHLVKQWVGLPLVAKQGAKGITVFVRYHESSQPKSTSFRDASRRQVVDILLSGRQTVVPPSIHPKGMEYKWVGPSLLDLDLHTLPVLGDGPNELDLGLLRAMIESTHLPGLLSGTGTHEPGVQLSFELVRAGFAAEPIKRAIAASLPPGYSGNSLDEIDGWVDSATDKMAADPTVGGDSDVMALKAFRLILESEVHLFVDQYGDARARFRFGRNQKWYASRLRGSMFSHFLTTLYSRRYKSLLPAMASNLCIQNLEAIAVEKGDSLDVHVRCGRKDAETIVIDLNDEAEGYVVISPDSVELVEEPPIVFDQTGIAGLPTPTLLEPGSGPDALIAFKNLLALSDDNWLKVLAFILSSLKGEPPFFVAIIEGEQGSGKSVLSWMLKSIIDPSTPMNMGLTNDFDDLLVSFLNNYLCVFDNVGSIKGTTSDLLSRVATGGGLAKRKLYSDGELFRAEVGRPFIINGISGVAYKADLIERSIRITLERRDDVEFRSEMDLKAQFSAILPRLLGEIYWVLARALELAPAIAIPPGMRMADAAVLLMAAEEPLDLKPGTFVDLLKQGQKEHLFDALEGDTLAIALEEMLSHKPTFDGLVGDLHNRLQDSKGADDRFFPSTPSQLSKRLKQLMTGLKKKGVVIEFGARNNKGQTIKISRLDENDSVAGGGDV